jgi:hypothetical protein
MKKSIILFLTFFYLITASGVNISLHYCGGKLKSISFFNHNNENSCCGKMMKKGCCKEKTITIKTNDNHNRISDLTVPDITHTQLLDIALPQATINFSNFYSSEIIPHYDGPPDIFYDPIFLRYRVLII